MITQAGEGLSMIASLGWGMVGSVQCVSVCMYIHVQVHIEDEHLSNRGIYVLVWNAAISRNSGKDDD